MAKEAKARILFKGIEIWQVRVNPVRNSGGALNTAGIILKCNPQPRCKAAGHYF